MNTQLQHAMAAVKAEPNNADAWFMLSQAVETDNERVKLLHKVLKLNPDHQQARDRLAQLTAPAAPVQVVVTETVVEVAQPSLPAEETPAVPLAMPISTNPLDFLAQSEADTIPPWMAGDTAVVATRAVAEPVPAAPAIAKEDIPSWLQEEPSGDWLGKVEDKTGRVVWKAGQEGGSEEQAAVEAVAKAEKAPAIAKQAAQTSFWTSNAFLTILATAAIFVLIALVAVWLGS